MTTNIIDKVITYFDPVQGLKRAKARDRLSTGFSVSAHEGTSLVKRALARWLPPINSANTELTETDNEILQGRSWDLYRNDEIAKAAITRVRTNVVATGLHLIPNLDYEFLGITEDESDLLEETIEREFYFLADSKDLDIERRRNFDEFQSSIIINYLVSGESFVNSIFYQRPSDIYSLKLQLIDSARVCNPGFAQDRKSFVRGVEMDIYGAPIYYHILKSHPSDIGIIGSSTFEWEKVSAFGFITGRRRFFHIFDPERAEQTRGFTYLAPVIEPLKQLKRYSEAELMAAVIGGMLTVFLESDESAEIEDDNPGFPKQDDDPDNGVTLGSGAVVGLSPGRRAKLVNPARPNVAFDPFFVAIARNIGAALELPLDEVLLRFEASYSAARASMLCRGGR